VIYQDHHDDVDQHPIRRHALRLTPDREADMHTRSGVPVYLDRPFSTAILARDLRDHAAGGTRYNGAPPVTILQHSVLVAALAQAAGEDEELVRYCAAHDLAEAVPLGEVVTGLKRHLPEYKAMEDGWEPRIRVACGLAYHLPAGMKARIKVYDLRALMCELWWYRHPCLAIKSGALPSRREKWVTALVMLPVVGSVSVLWRRLTRWLPTLREAGPL